MATTYAYQKGKHGGPCGTIFPFFRDLIGTNAQDEEYVGYIPAGFLRCRGQILSAAQYPELASVIKVGQNCIYRKSGVTLEEADANGVGGQIQLPDLGSKYISAGTTPGEYNNLTLSTDEDVSKAGIEVELSAAGTSIDFAYQGDFTIPSHPVNLFGQYTRTGSTLTTISTVSEGQILSHGHYFSGTQVDNATQPQCGYKWKFIKCWKGGFAGFGRFCRCNSNSEVIKENFMADIIALNLEVQSLGSTTGTRHSHGNAGATITSQGKTSYMQPRTFTATSLTTTVALKTATRVKIDAISPKFILCEYLIKY